MIDLNILRPYVFNMSKSNISIAEHDVATLGFDVVFDVIIKNMDCTLPQNVRRVQTINFNYTYEITKALHIIEHCLDNEEKQEEYARRLLDRHLANLEYEKDNPPNFLITANSVFEKETKKPIKRKINRSSEPKEKKPTVAERKKALKLNKFSAVPIKLKLQ